MRDCAATLREVASLAPGSIFAMSFLLPLQLADAETRPGLELAVKGARQRNAVHELRHPRRRSSRSPATPASAQRHHVSTDDLAARYFAGRSDSPCPARNAEELLVART
ncbi:hypothetical protein [Bradyrhizobium sp. ORS 111]|uniref:hypothetical protein n=1 Tax=Bradyrhizobium sp. ORS 111 TaxID=1685958 RepID=UPI00388F91BA